MSSRGGDGGGRHALWLLVGALLSASVEAAALADSDVIDSAVIDSAEALAEGRRGDEERTFPFEAAELERHDVKASALEGRSEVNRVETNENESTGGEAPGVAEQGVAEQGVADAGGDAPGADASGVEAPGVAEPGVAEPGIEAPGVTAIGLETTAAEATGEAEKEQRVELPLQLPRFSLGLDAQLLFREEAGGSRSPYPSLSPRLAFQIWQGLSTSLSYGWYLRSSEIGVGSVSERHHRLQLRADYAYPIRALSLGAGIGAVGAYQRSVFEAAKGEPTYSSSAFRGGMVGGVSLEVALPLKARSAWSPAALLLRTGMDVLWLESRVDLLSFVGIALPIGSSR